MCSVMDYGISFKKGKFCLILTQMCTNVNCIEIIARNFVETGDALLYIVLFFYNTRVGVIRMYEKKETPLCGALNSYIWNN